MRTGHKHLILAIIGGLIYVLIELVWRGHSHWTMFLLGGACFLVLGLINEVIPWDMSLQLQAFMGACIVTALEFLTGCLVNLWLGWGVWDYSGLSGNILGQICRSISCYGSRYRWLASCWMIGSGICYGARNAHGIDYEEVKDCDR